MPVSGPDFYAEHEVIAAAGERMAAVVEGQRGVPLSELDGGDEVYGHPAFTAAFAGFCDRWSVGVDALCDRAKDMGGDLRSTAEAYREADRQAAAGFAVLDDPGVRGRPGALRR